MNITSEQYAALVALARKGAGADTDQMDLLDQFLLDIEAANDMVRYTLHVRWSETGGALPVQRNFPVNWPPTLEGTIERMDQPILKQDVADYVKSKSRAAYGIMVTRDPAKLVGWTELEVYFR